jgi:uncharacterized protein (TIGR04255 family)
LEKYPIFTNAPIIEALLDIRVDLPPEVDIKSLESFYEVVKDRYPEKKAKGTLSVLIQIAPDGTPQSSPASGGHQGYFFRSPSENKIIQAKLDGFTFHKLKPYEEWTIFRDEAKQMWDKYRETFKPSRIRRISLRYINRIEVPLPFNDFNEYILTNPVIAPNLPQSLERFYMQVVIHQPNSNAIAIITQTMENVTVNNQLPLILDIDVVNENLSSDENTIWNGFNKLHDFKNEVFFNSITTKTMELFK